MQLHERVLVVLVKSSEDWHIARTRHWYRLPVKHGPRQIGSQWIAFYLPASVSERRRGVHYYARIRDVAIVRRVDLFPHEADHPRAQHHYFVISFDPPVRLARPLLPEHGRRFIWTETTWWRFAAARTFDELFSDEPLAPPPRDQVLVGVVPRVSDFEIVRTQRWYRIPRTMLRRWPDPGYLAFYFGHAFGDEAGQIRYYAEVWHADVVKRIELFPDQPRHPRAHHDYIRVHIGELQQRPAPIRSRRRRRIVLLPTTWERFMMASDLNDLVTGDADEEAFYGRLTEEGISAERAYYVRGPNAYYLTDLALFCRKGNVQVDIKAARTIPRRLLATRIEGKHEPADGWTALRLSRFDLARRPEESLRRIRALVDASGGMITE